MSENLTLSTSIDQLMGIGPKKRKLSKDWQ